MQTYDLIGLASISDPVIKAAPRCYSLAASRSDHPAHSYLTQDTPSCARLEVTISALRLWTERHQIARAAVRYCDRHSANSLAPPEPIDPFQRQKVDRAHAMPRLPTMSNTSVAGS